LVDTLLYPYSLDPAASGWGSVVADVYNNHATYSDRVLYSRRHTPTRERVNWSRGAAERDDSPVGPAGDASVAPDQTTSYNTSDDPTAEPDDPATDGEGSRHNYTAIGQVGLTYDNNRNLLADGTREFRYNYRNQLRRVWHPGSPVD